MARTALNVSAWFMMFSMARQEVTPIQGVGHLGAVDADDEQAVIAQLGYDGVGAKVVSHWFLLDS